MEKNGEGPRVVKTIGCARRIVDQTNHNTGTQRKPSRAKKIKIKHYTANGPTSFNVDHNLLRQNKVI